jgi:DNA modification methylase
MKPVALLEAMLRNSSRRGDLVLDPFAGSGSTMIACERLGRRCVAVEIDPAYCDVVRRRFKEHCDDRG